MGYLDQASSSFFTALESVVQDASAPGTVTGPLPGPPLSGGAAWPRREDEGPGGQDESTRGGEQVSQVLTAIHKRGKTSFYSMGLNS